jgi:hypothetical protein
MEIATKIILAVGAVSLLITGIMLACQDKIASASSVLGFATLMLVLLLISKFKSVEAFGLKAETWDEKQVEAAVLIDKLTTISTATSEQVGIIASKLGLWGGGLTIPEIGNLAEQTRATLKAVELPRVKEEEILSPIWSRIELDYFNVARHLLVSALRKDRERLDYQIPRCGDAAEKSTLEAQLEKINEAERNMLTYEKFKNNKSIQPLINTANSLLQAHRQMIEELRDVDLDLKYFVVNRRIRRKVDLEYIFMSQEW